MRVYEIIDQETYSGMYDMYYQAMIVRADDGHQYLLVEGWGADPLGAYMYRWSHGQCCRVMCGDTLASLRAPHVDAPAYNDWDEALRGNDPKRPYLHHVSGYAIQALADQAKALLQEA